MGQELFYEPNALITTKNSPPIIATHDGVFHCDDALACFLLKNLSELSNAEVIRTRDESLIAKADVVVDVGAVYDHVNRRYDHHQRSFKESLHTLRGDSYANIKLSSAGLVYHHYGSRIISKLLEKDVDPDQLARVTEIVFLKVYETFIKEIDAIDNGISVCKNPTYEIHTHLSARVKELIPAWNEELNDEILLERFHQATALVGKEFTTQVNFYGKTWCPVRSYVLEAVEKRLEVHDSGCILDLSCNKWGGSFPWKEHLLMIEEEMGLSGTFKFVVYKDTNNNYRVQAIPVDAFSFTSRIPLNKEWQGLRDESLVEKSGIPGSFFVHASGFIGGNKTREGAIEMAKKSLQLHVAST